MFSYPHCLSIPFGCTSTSAVVGEASTGPGVVGEVMLFRKEWYKIDELRRWRAEDIAVYTFFRDGHYTESKGE